MKFTLTNWFILFLDIIFDLDLLEKKNEIGIDFEAENIIWISIKIMLKKIELELENPDVLNR